MHVVRPLIVCLLLMLCACSGGEHRVVQGNRTGILHFGNGTEPQGLDPQVTTGVPESHIHQALFEGLVGKDPMTLKPVPAVAERWDISDDNKTFRFYLRHNARWSNGDPLTAEDFHWSWWRELQPKFGAEYSYMLFPIKNAEAYVTGKITDFSQVGVRVIDDYTLEVELAQPTPYFMQLLDHHSLYPVHRATIEKFGAATDRYTAWTRAENMVSNGAFKLKEWKLYKYVRVEKNPTYWDAANVKLNEIVFYPTENTVTEERMFRSGQLHRTEDLPVSKAATYRQQNAQELRMEPYLGTYYYRLNIRNPAMRDARVRRALAMAIDRDAIVNKVLNGVNFPAYSYTPPGTAGYQPPKLLSFDPAAAKKLLADAGYPNGQGLPSIEIIYNTHEGHRKIAVAVQQMWKTYLNIDVSIVNEEWKVYLDSVKNFNYTVARAGWIGDYVDPDTFLNMFVTDGGNNQTGWSNKEYDDLILREIPVMKTEVERQAGFYRAETILLNEMPIIPIYIYSTRHLINTSVKGMPPNIMDFYSLKHVYLEH